MAANHPRYARRQAERRAERDEFRGKRQRVSRRPMSGVELLNMRHGARQTDRQTGHGAGHFG